MSKSRYAFVLLAVSAGAALAAEPAIVDLHFAWSDGEHLAVTREFVRETSIGPKTAIQSSSCRYTWTASKHGSEYRIAFSDFNETKKVDAPASKDPVVLLEYVARKVEPILPTLVVDLRGQPKRLDGLPGVKTLLTKEINAIADGNDPQFQRLSQFLVNDAAIRERAWEHWNRMVQVWSGNRRVELDERVQGAGTMGQATGKPVESVLSYQVSAGPDTNTVQLEIVQTPKKPEDVRAAMESMIGSDVFKTLGISENSKLVFEYRFTTVADPSTLIPRTYRKVTMWGAYTGDQNMFRGRKDVWNYSFKRLNKP